jgi:hypothetical protein
MMRRRVTTAIFVVMVMAAAPASSQWIHVPLPGTPRMPDGQANLSASAPKTPDGKPDLSGIWRAAEGKYLQNIAEDLGEAPFQPWAATLYKQRVDSLAKGRPTERCLPHGIPDAMMVRSGPWKIVQTPRVTLILFEEMNHYRQVFTDGRGFPKDPNPAWFGYSIGKWEGDTFVVDTTGFNDQTWLDDPGHPHTDALHAIERFRRRDFGHLEIDITIDDAKAYTKPWTVTARFDLLPDTELIENVCDNEKDAQHMVGK